MKKSPKIVNLSWGKIEVEGFNTFKDVKLFPGGCREWNWQETGTSHSPGIQFSDAQELLDNNAKVIILSRGVLGRLKVQKKVIEKLELEGVIVHILNTKEAIKLYNDLSITEAVGALIHTTC